MLHNLSSVAVLTVALTLYSIRTHLKNHVFENIMENGVFAPKGANAPFSIIFSRVIKTFKFFLIFFNFVLK